MSLVSARVGRRNGISAGCRGCFDLLPTILIFLVVVNTPERRRMSLLDEIGWSAADMSSPGS
jgi:hypothetical protein